MNRKYIALILGQSLELCRPLPDLLFRAGFIVELIHTEKYFRHEKKIDKFTLAKDKNELIEKAGYAIQSTNYDLVIAGDDDTILSIKKSSLSHELRVALLPVIHPTNFLHLASKIGLSQVLSKAGITTPEYAVALNTHELEKAIKHLGFPLIIKSDFSGGGTKTFNCLNSIDAIKLQEEFKEYPAVIQRKITGDLISIDAFYQKGNLVHFSYATIIQNIDGKEFTPSKLREYTQTKFIENTIFDELTKVGVALGANGFSNISAIYNPQDKKYYFFEADMRPTVWVDFSKHFGECLAKKIRNYFDQKQLQPVEGYFDSRFDQKIIIPYFRRMSFFDFILNKNNVWNYTSIDYLLFRIYLRKLKHYLLAILNLRILRNRFKVIRLQL